MEPGFEDSASKLDRATHPDGPGGDSCRAGVQPLSGRGSSTSLRMELRNPCLDLAFISKVCFRGAEWSHGEVNDFGNLGVASQERTEGGRPWTLS